MMPIILTDSFRFLFEEKERRKKLQFVIFLWIALACCTYKNTGDSIVYITNTGNKYHTSVCRYLGKSALPISLKDACGRNYGPCSNCNPPFCQDINAEKDFNTHIKD